MPMLRAIRTLNNLEAGTLTGAALQTLLADTGRLGDLVSLLTQRGQARRLAASSTAMTAVAASSTAMTAVIASSTAMTAVIASSTAMTAVAASSTAMAAVAASSTAMTAVAASSTAMTAVAASSTAMTAVIASSTAMTAVIASSTAMTAVAASSTAMAAVAASSTAMTAVWASNTATDAVFASATARLAVYNSDTALAQLQYTPAQVARLDGLAVATKANTGTSSFDFVANGTNLILLRRYYSGTDYDYINWTRGSSSSGAGNGVTAGAGGRTLYTSTQARGCISGTYTDSGSVPITNDASANFVAAANGLRRHAWAYTATLYVSYILV